MSGSWQLVKLLSLYLNLANSSISLCRPLDSLIGSVVPIIDSKSYLNGTLAFNFEVVLELTNITNQSMLIQV